MDLYYGKAEGNNIVLDEDESHHLIKVKRNRTGDSVFVTDGLGNLFTTNFISVDKRNCILGIRETKFTNKRSPHLHIAIAPTKNIDRIEWFLEKATEAGIDEVSFLQCRHSERKDIKTDRLNRVLISAMKQSLKTILPKLNPIMDFNNFVSGNYQGNKIICTMSAGKNENLKNNYQGGKNLIALIGPEGDFHVDELSVAIQKDFIPISLSSSRLRTETAAMTICTLFNFVNSF